MKYSVSVKVKYDFIVEIETAVSTEADYVFQLAKGQIKYRLLREGILFEDEQGKLWKGELDDTPVEIVPYALSKIDKQ